SPAAVTSAALSILLSPLPARGERGEASVPFEGHEGMRADAVAAQQVHPADIGEVDEERRAGDKPPGTGDELRRCLRRAAGGDESIDDEDALARLDGVLVDLDDVDAIFERVLLADGLPRQLALLADGDEPAPQAVGHGPAEDEAACLDAGHRVDL